MIMLVFAIVAICIVQAILDQIMPRRVQWVLLLLGVPVILILALGSNPRSQQPLVSFCGAGIICDGTHH